MISGNISARNSEKLRTANNQVTSRIVEYINGMKTFRLYNLIGNHFTKLDETLQKLKKISTKSEISILPFALSFSVVTSFIVPFSLILGIYLFTVSKIDSATFLVLILLSVSVSSILNVLSSLYPQVRSISKASENILSVLHTKPLPYKMDNTDFSNFDIEFSDVSFQYTDFDFSLSSVMKNDTQSRQVLTQEQEEKLLAFVQSDVCYQKHYDEIIVLLRTGLRISEFCGLTVNDLDFTNRVINIDHQLIKLKRNYIVQPPKSENGVRQIPMSDEVYQSLKNILKHRRKQKELEIDGYKDFLFINRNGNPNVAMNYEAVFRSLVNKYNRVYFLYPFSGRCYLWHIVFHSKLLPLIPEPSPCTSVCQPVIR